MTLDSIATKQNARRTGGQEIRGGHGSNTAAENGDVRRAARGQSREQQRRDERREREQTHRGEMPKYG